MEQQRGISVTTSVMQFNYRDCVFNLLDTPGHEDFSEDTYRTLSAVDSVLMVIDVAKGVETRTIKLMEVCRLRTTPIITFINKLDHYGRDGLDLLDEIEQRLNIRCAPITWPIGQGSDFKGIYHLYEDCIYLYQSGKGDKAQQAVKVRNLDDAQLQTLLGDELSVLQDEVELVKGASHRFELADYLAGDLTPVYFGSALHNFGIQSLLDAFIEHAPAPQPRATVTRVVAPDEAKFTGFVFKIQANMDPQHRDRIAFLRVCSGQFTKGMKMFRHALAKA